MSFCFDHKLLNQQIKSQSISLAPGSQIKVDFPMKPAKIEVYMVKNGEYFPVELNQSGQYSLPEKSDDDVQHALSATWNKDNNSQYYFGMHIR
ncbi:hypothetical protein PTI45_01803 [Paenibacillus nuruki]|uniref:Uncharacterized protein n=2 Tax=Paenibacillus nuruki TaxID=1886670 RepID=A0A1E3L4S6_9BACL|nr:hypothetical protein PTI45_01803 [Paenibacillus nuruki]